MAPSLLAVPVSMPHPTRPDAGYHDDLGKAILLNMILVPNVDLSGDVQHI